MNSNLSFISSERHMLIKNINYTCERLGGGFYSYGHLTYHGTISLYSSKKIENNKPFSVAIVDIPRKYAISITNIWLTEYTCEILDGNGYFIYDAKFSAESIIDGNLKTTYMAFLRR